VTWLNWGSGGLLCSVEETLGLGFLSAELVRAKLLAQWDIRLKAVLMLAVFMGDEELNDLDLNWPVCPFFD